MTKAAAPADLLREVFRAYGRLGGRARAEKLSEKQRQAIARKGGRASAKKRKEAVA
jgi:hypothetical protein